jgi:hypothetical protein
VSFVSFHIILTIIFSAQSLSSEVHPANALQFCDIMSSLRVLMYRDLLTIAVRRAEALSRILDEEKVLFVYSLDH